MYKEFVKILPFSPYDYQLESFKTINENNNSLICMPTSAGKTILAYYYLYIAIQQGKKVILTTPLKALSQEKSDEVNDKDFFLNKIKPINALIDTGDTSTERLKAGSSYYDSNWDILITTNERLDVILRSPSLRLRILKDVKYIIFDEIHLLGNPSRGSTVEFIIMILNFLFPHIKIVGLSATLPNWKEFANWMNADPIIIPEDKRPVPLTDIFVTSHPSDLNSADRFSYKMQEFIKKLLIYPKDQFLIFVHSRRDAEKLVKLLLPTESRYDLDTLISKNLAYHHAGVSKEKRTKIETLFKQKKIQIIAATPTLAMGINLPCTNVVMFGLSRWNPHESSLKVIEDYLVLQMRGRAGRPQYDTFGRCFFLGDIKELMYAKDVINAQTSMMSQIETMIDEKILALISAEIANSAYDIIEIFKQSFGYKQFLIKDDYIGKEIDFLIKHKFIQVEDDELYPTVMGFMCNQMYVKPRTVIEVFNNFRKSSLSDEEDIMSCFLKNGELLEPIRIERMDYGLIKNVRKIFPSTQDSCNVYVYNYDKKEWKTANKSNEYAKLMGFIYKDQLKSKAYISDTELWVLRENTVRLVQRLWSIIRTTQEFKEEISQNTMRKIFAMIKYGTSDEDKAFLGAINGIGHKTYERLVSSGIDKLSKFLKVPNYTLRSIGGFSDDRIKKLKSIAVKSFPEYEQYLHKAKSIDDFF